MNAHWLGVAGFALFAVATLQWARASRAVRLPENRSGYVAAWFASALLGGYALWSGVGWLVGVPSGLALFGGALLCVLVAISPQEVAADAIRVGERLRDFEAPDESGAIFRLSEAAGQAILLKFFRGHW